MEALITQALVGEHHALIEALFSHHPQWRETVDCLRQGHSNRAIASLQHKHLRSVERMRRRMRASGLELPGTLPRRTN